MDEVVREPRSWLTSLVDVVSGTLFDSSRELREGCAVSDFVDTIPAEFEELLAFSEGQKP